MTKEDKIVKVSKEAVPIDETPVVEVIELPPDKKKGEYEVLYTLRKDRKDDVPFHKGDEQMIVDVSPRMKQCRVEDIPCVSTLYSGGIFALTTGKMNWEKDKFSMMLVRPSYKFDPEQKDLMKIVSHEVDYMLSVKDKPEGFHYERHEITDKTTKLVDNNSKVKGFGKIEPWKKMRFSDKAPLKYMVIFKDTGDPKTSIPLACHELMIRGGTTWTDGIGLCDTGVWQISIDGS